jgi:hypothetical protein
MPTTHLRTFAADTATLLTSCREQPQRLRRIMTTYGNITTMDINTTLFGISQLKAPNHHGGPEHHELPRYTWAAAGKYLGFIVGPAAQSTSWKVPTEKRTERLHEWPWSKIGRHLSLRLRNTFLLRMVLFIQHPPSYIIGAEKKAQNKFRHVRRAGAPWRTFNTFTTSEARSSHLNADAASSGKLSARRCNMAPDA